MDNVNRLRECIKIAERHIAIEKEDGSHTLHNCACSKSSCREIKCVDCWRKDLKEYKENLKKEMEKHG